MIRFLTCSKEHFRSILMAVVICAGHMAMAQTFGPNSPSSGTNSTSIGTLSWTAPGNVLTSNNSYASVVAKGITNYLSATNFGFTLPVTTSITGIRLEVEKSTLTPTVVTTLNAWSAGLTKTVSAGSNRMLLFVASMENGSGARDITALTYGGQAMTQIVEGVVGTTGGFQAKMEFWVLLNSGIAAATNTLFVPTFAGGTLTENIEYYASAVFAGVDQTLPYTSTQIYTLSGAAATLVASPTLAVTGGGMAVAAIHNGNNTTPAKAVGGTNTYLVGGGFTEILDTYTANPGFTSSGMCTEISQQSISVAGSVTPSYTFAGTSNRQIVIYANLTCLREIDNSVRLIKGGTITGNNAAFTVTPWNTTDTYISYGSSSDLWGTTWTVADINATNFGAVLSASVNNGTAQVDHMRITVTGFSTLPVELTDFYGNEKNGKVFLEWQTASEHKNKQFVIERSSGLNDFVEIGKLKGHTNSKVLNSYEFTDKAPLPGINYYRLKQEDYDGAYEYSETIAVVESGTEMFSVYPNPTYDGHFKIASEQIIQPGVYIYSDSMKLIKMIDSENSKELDLSVNELTDGIYYLVFNTGGQQKIKKLIKVCK